MRQTSFADMHCSLARSLEVIGDWWSPLILRDLGIGPRRFDELAGDLGISRNLLTTRLEGLMAAGVIGSPELATDNSNVPSPVAARTTIGLFGNPWVMALPSRFEASWLMRCPSQSTTSVRLKSVSIVLSG